MNDKTKLPYPARLRDSLRDALIMIKDDAFKLDNEEVVHLSEVERVFEDLIAGEIKTFKDTNQP